MPSTKSPVNIALSFLFCMMTWSQAGHGAPMDDIAEEWVKLALALGQQEEGYVDAYQGPAEWQEAAKSLDWSLKQIRQAATQTQQRLAAIEVDDGDLREIEILRHRALTKLLSSLQSRIEMLQGRHFTFDEESMALYDAVAPHHEPQHFQEILNQLDVLLPGEGSLGERRNAFRELFVIPEDKLDAVFQVAIAECRKRTLPHIPLPEGEGFTVEYVTDKPWSGYNWFQGDSQSLIQVNTDLPIYIDRAIDLACHEGYPGHHVYNLLLEQNLYRKRGWVEFSIYVLYGPQALIAEGSANYGINMTFPRKERIAFEKAQLFPLAGLDPDLAERYYQIESLVEKLDFANNEAARAYVDGDRTRAQTIDYLMKYSLLTLQRAEQRIRFIDAYRSYVISYNLGQELVGQWIESVDGKATSKEQRWERFIKLLSAPYIPSQLK